MENISKRLRNPLTEPMIKSDSAMSSPYLTMIKRYADEAEKTDYIMPLWLPFLPAILAVVSTFPFLYVIIAASIHKKVIGVGGAVAFAGLAAAAGTFFLLCVASIAVGIYVLYKLISRRNDHFGRTHKLYEAITNLLKEKEGSTAEIVEMESIVYDMKNEETEKNAVLWIILTILVGIVWFYIAHFLNKDFRKHELRERRLISIINNILRKHGAPGIVSFEEKVPERNTILYIILAIITLGFFGLYWIYTLAKDPNEHFKQHKVVENQLIAFLESI